MKRNLRKMAMRAGKVVEEEEGLWSELGVDLLELIIRQLSFVERLISRSVCISWSFMNITTAPPLYQMPMLMVFDDEKFKSCKLVDPTSKKTYTVNTKSLKKRKVIRNVEFLRVHESKYGWLLISSQYDKSMFSHCKPLFLYTPFSNDHNNFIQLPTRNLSERIVFATFSSDPLSEDCLFLTLDVYKYEAYDIAESGVRLVIRTCRRGDNKWSKRIIKGIPIDPRCYDSNSFMYSEGILYFASNAGKIWCLDICQDEWVVLPPPPDVMGLNGFFGEIHMVKLDGELLVITGVKDNNVVNNRCTFHATFLRLDLSLMTWKWDLGSEEDCVLTYFSGNGYNSVLRCSEQPRYCRLSNSHIMSYLNQPSLELYGSMAAQPYMKLWIDPVVITCRSSNSSSTRYLS